jgi:hypothetical protein
LSFWGPPRALMGQRMGQRAACERVLTLATAGRV